MNKSLQRAAGFLLLFTMQSQVAIVFAQGSLAPPGAPAPTMKSLAQIEPRTDVLTLSGNANNQYVVSQSGAYYLTASITGVASKNGILIQADNVTLDLNGFSLLGGLTNSQVGISVSGAHVGLVIRNGTLSGWGGNGLTALSATGSEFDHLRLLTNGNVGIKVGGGNTVANCFVLGNAGDGLDTTSNCTVAACNVTGNLNGISAGNGCTLRDCTVDNNPNAGISTGNNCTLAGCNVAGNSNATFTANGISTGSGCILKNCNESGSSRYGIISGQKCTIQNCVANGNSAYGLIADVGSSVIGCTGNGNGDAGIYTFSGCTVADCSGATNEFGIWVNDGCTVKGCSAYYDYGTGINVGDDCTIVSCTGSFDGDGFDLGSECTIINCTACANDIQGITAEYSCLIKDNTTASNSRYSGVSGGSGIYLGDSGNRVEGNNSNSDGVGITAEGTENVIIHNTVRAAALYNYNIVSGNMVGTIVNAAASGVIQGNTGGSGLGTSDIYANFSF